MSIASEKTEARLGKTPPPNKKSTATAEQPPGKATRETIESVIIAIILAFLFRTFEAEAFVIPTGSMAPTLQGAHKDVFCPQCGKQYRTGASHESDGNVVVGSVCPICRFPHVLDPYRNANEKTFTGDRILVSKFAYQIGEPERWDPIVFKFPGNPKQNYIKRLVGLPGEEGRIFHGDVFAISPIDQRERILRKPPRKLVAMLQTVDDTDHVAPALVELGWPSRWQKWTPPGVQQPAEWSLSKDHRGFATDGQGELSWMRYKHLAPFEADWLDIAEERLPADLPQRRGMLITDFYTYNLYYTIGRHTFTQLRGEPPDVYERRIRGGADGNHGLRMATETRWVHGKHWVGDLGLECTMNVTSDSGEVLLDLVEGGRHHTCRIDVATGVARLEIDQGNVPFVDDDGQETRIPEGQTELRGKGRYHLRWTNCDDEVLLWVNGRVVAFNGPTTYAQRPDCRPRASSADPGDLAPAGIGTRGASFSVGSVRVLRDVYYIASHGGDTDYGNYIPQEELTALFSTPELIEQSEVWDMRQSIGFSLGADQFFPLGDNSPQSMDARSWSMNDAAGIMVPRYVDRELLIGKALMIYWPHAWNAPVPFTPNVRRMGVIR
jgi:signal peptidase I